MTVREEAATSDPDPRALPVLARLGLIVGGDGVVERPRVPSPPGAVAVAVTESHSGVPSTS